MTTLLRSFEPFWFSNHTSSGSWFYEIKDDKIYIEVALPGILKDDVKLTYRSGEEIINIFVKEKIDKDIRISRQIDPDNIDAHLDLGVLKIVAPIKNTDKEIKIR